MSMLKTIEETLAPKIGKLIPSDVGKAEAVETIGKTVEGQKPHELNAWVKTRNGELSTLKQRRAEAVSTVFRAEPQCGKHCGRRT